MSDLERKILDALRRLDSGVAAYRDGGPKPDLPGLFQELDDLTASLPARETPADLLHYLHKKSYEKARLFLEGRDAENARGACRTPAK